MRALDRAKILGLVDVGLSPFLYWWSQRPDQPFYLAVVGLLAVTALVFLSSLNVVLYRLSAMLPDESLREETKHFTTLNRYLVLGILLLGLIIYLKLRFPTVFAASVDIEAVLGQGGLWLMIFLVLLPLAMTMALLWKIKETIMDSVFGVQR